MTRLERFRAFLAREPMDRPMRYASFTPNLLERLKQRLGGANPTAYFEMDTSRYISMRPPDGYQKPDFRRYYEDVALDERVEIDSIGVARRRGDLYHFTRIISPLRNASSLQEIESFPIETCADWREDHMAEEARQLHKAGEVVSVAITHLYEEAWQIRGYEQFLTDLMERPEWSDSILDRLTQRNIRRAQAAARAGADIIRTGDDIANQRTLMFNPELWRKTLKSRWARIYEAARAIKPDIAIWYHSDGNISSVIDDLVEIGVTILNPLQPECMDVEEIFRRYGHRLLFDGTIGTQSIFPWGTPSEMRALVRRRREVFGNTLILSPTHVLEPEVPIENIFAFFQACDEQI